MKVHGHELKPLDPSLSPTEWRRAAVSESERKYYKCRNCEIVVFLGTEDKWIVSLLSCHGGVDKPIFLRDISCKEYIIKGIIE